jgi:GxxExxY protein
MALYDDPLADALIGCAINVHKQLGPGLMESAYQRCLEWELRAKEIPFLSDEPVPLVYNGMRLDCGYRLDLFVGRKLIVELKAVERFAPIHTAQVLTYMKLMSVKHGLLINFYVPKLKDGIKSLLL